MTLGQWWQILALYEFILVWPLALFVLFKLLRAKTRTGRAVGIGTLFLLFTPFFHRWAGDFYFDYLCEHKAGEFIYRTVDNVEGILQMRPRDGSKDYFDRMAKGDIPEDPWGHTNLEAQEPWLLFRNYKFFEKLPQGTSSPPAAEIGRWHWTMFEEIAPDTQILRYQGYDGEHRTTMMRVQSRFRRSSFGYTWHGQRALLDRLFNVHPGEMIVLNLNSGLVLAKTRGFYRSRPRARCGGPKDETFAADFVGKVLIPTKR